MGKVMDSEIIAIRGKNNERYCLQCVPDDLFREITLEDLITKGEIESEGSQSFCDLCRKPLITPDS
ncbi:MAG TPA: hypothetical protein PLT09_11620 [Deltaproteobacteria bacterium]|nr:hypothetical protein [Deltaproteobacteria bacterium]HPR56254.1 hypothetical protein [Deltaproteobacteria bacterium]HXK48086.1 hypothetical protein [Deltaproteobacteria bacterium]